MSESGRASHDTHRCGTFLGRKASPLRSSVVIGLEIHRRLFMRRVERQRLLAVLMMAFALAVGGCGATSAPSSSATHASDTSKSLAVTCSSRSAVHAIDTITLQLDCAVSHAPVDQSSFTLSLMVTKGSGNKLTSAAKCVGSLRAGSGTCEQSYNMMAPFAAGTATVAGTLQPSGQPLGPVQVKPAP